jgi:hypothetical protein
MKRKFIPIPNLTVDEIKRFWSYVSIRGVDDCWEWKVNLRPFQYARFKTGNEGYRSHRIAYFLGYGADPKELFVCHKCDNPRCCNPNHLFLGTPKDNTQDMVSKKRHNVGESKYFAKLTDKDIKDIRESIEFGNVICRRYKVSKSVINNIRNRKAWNHLPVTKTEHSASDTRKQLTRTTQCCGSKHYEAKLTEAQVKQIRRAKGTHRGIAKKFGISHTNVRNIKIRKTWKHLL